MTSSSSEWTKKAGSDIEPSDPVHPRVQTVEGSSRSRTTFISYRSSSSSEILSSSTSFAESTQSTPTDAEMGEAVSPKDEIAHPPASSPVSTGDVGLQATSSIPFAHLDGRGKWSKSENVDVEASLLRVQSLDASRSSTSDSFSSDVHNPEDMSIPQLEDLLQLDVREFANDSDMAFVDNLFPTRVGDDNFPSDIAVDWAMDCFPELPSLHMFPQIPEVSNNESAGRDASHQWLQNYLRRFSSSDLRKIKLKKSTVENATKRLGGGRKGMLCFLKLVLVWLLAQNAKRSHSVTSGSLGFPDRDYNTCGANEHAACSSGTVEDNSAKRVTSTALVSLDGNSKQEQGFSPSVVGRNEDDRVATFGDSKPSLNTHIPNPVAEREGFEHLAATHSPYSQSLSYSAVPTDRKWNSLHSFSDTEYQWRTRDGDGGGKPLSNSNESPGGPFPPRLPQKYAGESEWDGYCGSSLQGRNLHPSPETGGPAANYEGFTSTACDFLSVSAKSSAEATRAARKSRMERRKSSFRHQQRWSSTVSSANLPWQYPIAGASLTNNTPSAPQNCQRPTRSSLEIQQVKKPERNLRLLFQKELKQSDVGSLGRIVVPKKAAETSLPPIDLRDGVTLVVEDLNSSKVWNMRYRFWPNNKSRMYLLENTGDFIKSYNLKEGDYMVLYINTANNKYMIRGDKARGGSSAAMLEHRYSDFPVSSGYGVLNNSRTDGPQSNVAGSSYYANQPNRYPAVKSEEGRVSPEVELDDTFIADLERSLEDVDDT